jgi:transposase
MERIGVDISKLSFIAAYVQGGKYVFEKVLNTIEGIRAFLDKFDPAHTHLVMEYTGNYEMKLALEAQSRGFKVSIIAGSCIRHFAKMRGSTAKTDKEDARNIHKYAVLEGDQLPDFSLPPVEIAHLKQLRQRLNDLQVHRQSLINKLDSNKLNPQSYPFLVQQLERSIDFNNTEIELIEQQIAELTQADDQLSDTRIPQSVPGIGPKIAAELALFAKLFKDFEIENIPKMIKVIGLSPTSNQSGNFKGKGTIAKGSYAALRHRLYMGAVACVTNPRTNNSFKEFYLHLRRSGKPFKCAIVAVMAKMVKVAFTLMISRQMYDKNKHVTVSANNIC